MRLLGPLRSGAAIAALAILAILLPSCTRDGDSDGDGGGSRETSGTSETTVPPRITMSPPPAAPSLSLSESLATTLHVCGAKEIELPAVAAVRQLVRSCLAISDKRLRYWNVSPTTVKVYVYGDHSWEDYQPPTSDGLLDDVLTYGLGAGEKQDQRGYFYALPAGTGVDLRWGSPRKPAAEVLAWPEHGRLVLTARTVADLLREMPFSDLADRRTVAMKVVACAGTAVQLADQVSTDPSDPEGIKAGIETSYNTYQACRSLFDEFSQRLSRQRATSVASREVAETVARVTSREASPLLASIGRIARVLHPLPRIP